MTTHPPLVLASRSPRRADLLTQLGVPFVVDSADIDESPLPGESPQAMVTRLATAKCLAVASRYPSEFAILGADTTVDLDGEIFGTPTDLDHARRMLERLAGRTHRVHTAVCVSHAGTHRTELDTASVTMHPIEPPRLERYLATGESLDKAGGYAVQGQAGPFVERVTGQLTTVVGLPVEVVERLLTPLGLLPRPPHP